MTVPIIIKILISLSIIIALSKWIKHLHIPIVIAALFLAFSCGHTIQKISLIAIERTISTNNIFLLIVVIMIICLSSQMSEAGVMKELVNRVRLRVSQKTAIGLLPALIGLLPMPGGALFSAPLVDDCDHKQNIDSQLKTKINYWFRHVWEYWWPLYPGVLLAMEITNVEIAQFMMVMFPISLISIGVGYYFLLRPIKNPQMIKNDKKQKPIFTLLIPIFLIIAIFAIIKIFIPVVSNFNKYLPMVIGIAGAILYLQLTKPIELKKWQNIIFSKRVWVLTLLVLLIRIYGAFLEVNLPNGNNIVDELRTEIELFNIPPIVIIMAIPFICGLTTGLAIGFVGASFPIVMSMLGTDPTMNELLPSIALAYGCGYLGMLLSPVHVCLIVSNQHFQTKLYDSIKQLTTIAIVMLGLLLCYYFLLKTIC
jgi:uncharacterized protein